MLLFWATVTYSSQTYGNFHTNTTANRFTHPHKQAHSRVENVVVLVKHAYTHKYTEINFKLYPIQFLFLHKIIKVQESGKPKLVVFFLFKRLQTSKLQVNLRKKVNLVTEKIVYIRHKKIHSQP